MKAATKTNDRWPRIQMARLETNRLKLEAETCTDPKRLRAIGDELQVLYDSMLEVRREQIMDSMPKPKIKRPHWWGLHWGWLR